MPAATIAALAPHVIQALTLAASAVDIFAKDDPTEDDAARLRRELGEFETAMANAYTALDNLDATIAAKRAQGGS